MLVLTRKEGESIRITTPDNHIIEVMITIKGSEYLKMNLLILQYLGSE